MAAQDELWFVDDGEEAAASAVAGPPPGPRIYKVYELAHLIRDTLESRFPEVTVEGEVSGYRGVSQSGHHYFDIKDESGTLSVALFRGSAARGLKTQLRMGDLVRVTGRVSVFEKSGRMQLIATRVEPAGMGALLAQLEKLKEQMRAEGLFDEARKRALPFLPRRIGVVTSPTGAVLRDIVTTLRRRNPYFSLLVSPAPMQGITAAPAIIEALRRIDAREDVEVLILARGGGSMEDLWCFNDEALARLLPTLRHPVITAVGHETDTTLVDYTSDRRAATPTAAAELVLPALADLQQTLLAAGRRLRAPLAEATLACRRRLERAASSPLFRHPTSVVDDRRQVLDFVAHRIAVAFSGRPGTLREALARTAARLPVALRAALPAARARVTAAGGRLGPAATASLREWRATLTRLEASVRLLDPTAVLRRGYTLTRLADGTLLRSPGQVAPGTRLVTRTAAGDVHSIVSDTLSVPALHPTGPVPTAPTPSPQGAENDRQQEKTDLRGKSGGARTASRRDGKRQAAAGGTAQEVRARPGADQGLLFALD